MNRSVLITILLIVLIINISLCQSRKIRGRNHGKNKNRELKRDGLVAIGVPKKLEEIAPLSSHLDQRNLNNIYGDWSQWGRCTRRCKQVRWRQCVSEVCGESILKEERPCRGERCPLQPDPVILENTSVVIQKGRTPADLQEIFRMRSVVYSSWSEWSPCSKNCRTKRRKTCEFEGICGNSAIEEDAFCYDRGSQCEDIFNDKKRRPTEQPSPRKPKSVKSVANTNTDNLDPLEPYHSTCGVSSIPDSEMSLRIIGGRETTKGRWPWQVIILNRYKEAFCGGTIISPNWILTAAHCVRKRLFIRAGEHDLVENDGTEQEIRVDESIPHPDYDADTVDNDIALLRLRHPLTFNDYVKPACLPETGSEMPLQTRAFILGWGKRRNTALYGTDVLHEAEVPVVDLEDCKQVYKDYFISDNMLCAGYKRGRVDSCAGDSGGPLLYREDKKWAIYGVTSFGEGCGKKGKFGIYAKVSNFVDWIHETMETE